MAGDTERHVSWEVFDNSILSRVPGVFRVPGEPVVDIFVDEGGRRIGLATPISASGQLPPSPMAEMETRLVVREGQTWLEIASVAEPLFREFYLFLTGVSDRIQLMDESPLQALDTTLATLQQLLARRQLLNEDRQLGLVGELWLLDHLLDRHGTQIVAAWTGPTAEPHDFRLGSTEIEVKSTRTGHRVHMINGLGQLQASPERALFMLSLQFEPGGAQVGMSLPDRVEAIRAKVQTDPKQLALLNERLLLAGYRDDDAVYYPAQLQLRTEPMLIAVDAAVPRITRAILASALTAAERIQDVQYRLDVEGLGIRGDDSRFEDVLSQSHLGKKDDD